MSNDPFTAWLAKGLQLPGKSQSGLARALNLDPSAVNRIVNNKRKLQTHEIAPAASYLGIDPPEIEVTMNSTAMRTGYLVGTVEAGTFREVDTFDEDGAWNENRYIAIPDDPQFPQARALIWNVAGDSMNALQPRPIMPGDRVVAVSYEDVAHNLPMRDGMVVVLERTRDGGMTREWSIKQIELYEDRVEFCPRSTSLRHKPIVIKRDLHADDGTTVTVVAVVRRVINDIPLS